MLSFREMNPAIFRGEDPGGVLWQPRLEYWYEVNKKRGTLPEHLKEASLLDIYDYCHASVRYFTNPLRGRYKNVRATQQRCPEPFVPGPCTCRPWSFGTVPDPWSWGPRTQGGPVRCPGTKGSGHRCWVARTFLYRPRKGFVKYRTEAWQ